MEKGRNNAVLLTVIGIATLLVAIVGATFAYFSAQTTYNDNNSTLTIRTTNGGNSEFIGGDNIVVNNIYPIDNKDWVTKTISIHYTNVEADASFRYPYKLQLVYNNGFAAETIKYTFERVAAGTEVCPNSTSDGQPIAVNGTGCGTPVTTVTAANETMVGDVASTYFLAGENTVDLGTANFAKSTDSAGSTHTYLLKIQFPNKGSVNQNSEQGKQLTAYVKFVPTNA